MYLKKTNSQFSFLLRFAVVLSLLFGGVNTSVGQLITAKKETSKQVNQPEIIQLIDLLENLKEATGFTFVFDKEIIQNKTVVFDRATRQNLNRLLIE